MPESRWQNLSQHYIEQKLFILTSQIHPCPTKRKNLKAERKEVAGFWPAKSERKAITGSGSERLQGKKKIERKRTNQQRI